MKLYLVRHGETVGNRANFHQVPETPLTEKGLAQAREVAKRLKKVDADLVYSSTNKRAVQTAEIIAKELGIAHEEWPDLIEIRRPKEIVGKSAEAPEIKKIEDTIFANFHVKGYRYSDEENFEDLVARADKVFDHLLEKHKDQTIICVSHGTFIKVLMVHAIFRVNLTPEIFSVIRHNFWAENTGVTILEHTDKHGFRLLSWNDTSHL